MRLFGHGKNGRLMNVIRCDEENCSFISGDQKDKMLTQHLVKTII